MMYSDQQIQQRYTARLAELRQLPQLFPGDEAEVHAMRWATGEMDDRGPGSKPAQEGAGRPQGRSSSSIDSDTQAKRDDAPKARQTLAYEFADEIGEDGGEADELVERMLTRGAMSVLYGDSNSGKTFAAIDLGAAVARGIPWMDRNVELGLVIYLASESPASVRMRLRAYQREHDVKVPNFVIVKTPIDLYKDGSDAKAIIDLIRGIEAERAAKVELVIGDTLSRLCAGANENSGEDMSVVVRRVDRIRQECNAHFTLIHHTGKDVAKGARGWSGLRAATDTEIEVTADADSGLHAAEITKQRDIPGKGDRIGFRLRVVELGIGKWQRPITSCVVVPADAPAKAASKRPSEIAGAIVEHLMARGSGRKKRELVEHFADRYTSSAIYRELRKMAEAGKLKEVAGIVALVKE